jgi:hypothetical protein
VPKLSKVPKMPKVGNQEKTEGKVPNDKAQMPNQCQKPKVK